MRQRITRIVPFIAILLAISLLAGPVCAAKAKAQPFTFVVIGDNQNVAASPGPPPVFKEMVGEIAKLKPAFVLHVGDFVPGSSDMTKLKRQYWEFKKVMDTVGVPYYLALGNHDGGGKAAHQLFQELFKKTYYSFDYRGSHFVVLDSTPAGEAHRIDDAQFAWLEKDLAATKGKADHIFVMAHDPLYPVDGHIGSSLDKYPEGRDKLAALFRKYGVVYFCGHEHLFDHDVYHGVTQVITGGAGAGLYKSKKGTGDFHHFVVITVNGRSAKLSVVQPGKEPSAPVDLVPKGGTPGS
jgi:3',5'-cyclic AMP phosphodiesterase CpdA